MSYFPKMKERILHYFRELYYEQPDKFTALSIGLDKLVEETIHNQWIPCCERLPENRQIVLVTFVEHNELIVETVKYLNGEWEEPNYSEWTLDKKDVLAWYPLPEPYRPKGE